MESILKQTNSPDKPKDCSKNLDTEDICEQLYKIIEDVAPIVVENPVYSQISKIRQKYAEFTKQRFEFVIMFDTVEFLVDCR